MPSRKLVVEIVGDSSSLERAFSRSAKSASRFNVGIGTLLKSAVVFRAANEAMTGLGNAVRGSIGEFASQQKVAAQTNAVIKSTAGIANVTATRVNKLAGAIQTYSGIDDEAIVAGENLLLTFKNIRNEVGKGNAIFDRATKAAVDLSVAGFGSLDSTSKQLGKALNDPVKGMTALGRAGVTFSEGQKETIKQLVKTGDTLGAQKLILKEVTSQVGGSAAAFGKTIPGALARTSEAFKNMGGAIVGAVAPAFATLANRVASELPKIQQKVEAFVDRFKAARTVTAKIELVLETVGNLAAQAAKIARVILNRIGEALAQIDWRVVGERIGQGLSSALDSIAAFVRSVDWATVGGAVVSGVIDFLKGVDWVGLFKSIVQLWVAALKAGAKLFVGAGKELLTALLDGLKAGARIALLFIEKWALELVAKVVGVFGFLGRFNPFKGVEERVKRQIAVIQTAIDSLHGKSVDITINVADAKAAENLGVKASQAYWNGWHWRDEQGKILKDQARVQEAWAKKMGKDPKMHPKPGTVFTLPGGKSATADAKPTIKVDVPKAVVNARDAGKKVANAAKKAFETTLGKLELAFDIAGRSKSLKDDLIILKQQEKVITARLKVTKNDLDLQKQLVSVQNQQLQIQKDIAENQRSAAQAKQFETLGLTGTGEARTPGVAALKSRAASMANQIKGTTLDTPKVRSKLAAIAKVLAQGYRKVGKDVRAAILQMLNDISGALNDKGKGPLTGPLTKTSGLNSKKILEGLGLSPDQIRELRGRLSSFNSAGMGLAGSQTQASGGSRPFRESGAIIVENNVTVAIDGQKFSAVVTKQQQKTRRRNPKQKRGPNRMTGGV